MTNISSEQKNEKARGKQLITRAILAASPNLIPVIYVFGFSAAKYTILIAPAFFLFVIGPIGLWSQVTDRGPAWLNPDSKRDWLYVSVVAVAYSAYFWGAAWIISKTNLPHI
jgi:hypothetical protein